MARAGADLQNTDGWIRAPRTGTAIVDEALREITRVRGGVTDPLDALDLADLKDRMRGRALVDLRNIYNPAEAAAAGLDYTGIGRGGAA